MIQSPFFEGNTSLTERLEAHRERLGDQGASWQLSNDLSAAIKRIEELEARIAPAPSDPFPPAPAYPQVH